MGIRQAGQGLTYLLMFRDLRGAIDRPFMRCIGDLGPRRGG